MADADDKKKNEDIKEKSADTDAKKKDEKNKQPEQAGSKINIMTLIIMAVIVVFLAGSGFVLGRLFADPSTPETTESPQEDTKTKEVVPDNSQINSQDNWYYSDLESVVVNPFEPGATRYVRVGLILEMSFELNESEASILIENKKPLMISWLNVYLKGLTLSEMENDKDMKRILSQTCDSFNEILFPEAKPKIKRILIREFNIQ